MGVLLHLVTLVGLVKSLFLAVRALLGCTPVGCFASLGCFAPHSLGEASHLRSVSLELVATKFSSLVMRDAIAVVRYSNTDLSLVAAAERLSN